MQTELSIDTAKSFVTAGCARFTIQSNETKKHFTYQIKLPKHQQNIPNPLFFVGLLTLGDNENGYTYIGTLKNKHYTHGKKAKITEDAPGVVAFKWFISHLYNNSINGRLTFFHEGYCCKCGRSLTTPKSCADGIGPECIKKYKMAA